MESRTLIKNVNMSPKKLRFLAREVSKLSPIVAIDYLTYTPKKGARLFATAIKSAVNNATFTLKTEADRLVFKSLAVDEGLKLKRFNPGSKGMVKPYKKKFSHIKIVLTATKAAAAKSAVEAPKKEEAPKAEVKKAEAKAEIKAPAAKKEVKKVTNKKPVKKAAAK